MKELLVAGVNIFRFNMKHNSLDWHLEKINQAVEIAAQYEMPLGILIDLQGPEVRIQTHAGEPVLVTKHSDVRFSSNEHDLLNDPHTILIPQTAVIESLEPNDQFSIDDGYLQFRVVEKHDHTMTARALGDYTIKHNKSLNLFQKDLPLPSLVESDLEKLDIATQTRIDFVALSFVRDQHDVDVLRQELKKRDIKAQIIAKIENQKGVDNIDTIIDHADGIMLGRGDLGVETPIETITYFQKETIKKCRQKSKPVIVATQMLESMIHNPIPTRAEVADVANAVFDLTDCMMLSGESAYGDNPVLAAQTMTRIIHYNESKVDTPDFRFDQTAQTHHIAQAAVRIAHWHDVSKIIAFTETGYTARVIASLRPPVPVLAVSNQEKTIHAMAASFGVISIKSEYPIGDLVVYNQVIEELQSKGYVERGEVVVLVHGQRLGEPGKTNALVILNT